MPCAVGLAAALSASMEMLQVYVPGRTCSLLDVVCNVTGAAAGAMAAAAWLAGPADRHSRREWAIETKRETGAVVLLACWAGFQWYPFFPALNRTRLHAALGVLFQAHRFQLVEIFASGAEWLAAAVLLGACVPGLPEEWMAFAVAGCLVGLVVQGRVLTAEEVIGAALGLWLWLIVRKGRRLRLAAGMLAAAIVLRELAPFHLTHFPAPFGWMPFVASMGADRQAALIVLLRKAFDYGAVIWLLHRLEVRYWIAGSAVAAALLAGEWLQRYLPGRTPESTDALLAVILAGVLGVLSRRESWQYNL